MVTDKKYPPPVVPLGGDASIGLMTLTTRELADR
jgi:hypothetical protein